MVRARLVVTGTEVLECRVRDENGENTYERDYERIPMTPFETFCDEHFGGVVGG